VRKKTSESFKLSIKSYIEASGESVQGYWSEAARNLTGHLTGRIAGGRFEGEISAPAFQSNLCNAHKELAFLSNSSIGVVVEHSG
jgi:hypothetical protein